VNQFILSVDLGQMNDWTAYSILEERTEYLPTKTYREITLQTETKLESKSFVIRHLERPELRTPYDKIVDQVDAMLKTPALAGRTDLIIDITGVGRPVYDMMVRAGLRPIPITITGGSEPKKDDQGGFHVPKRDIAMALQVAFATKRLKIAKGQPLAPLLLKEVEAFKVKINKSGNETYEAWRESDHDDIVMSVGMGIWYALLTRRLVTPTDRRKKKADDYDILHY
jgi:hypothetical protein